MLGSNKQYGLTIDHGGVRYAQVKRKKKGWEIDRTGFLPFADGVILEDQFTGVDELRGRLKEWVKKERLQGKSIHLSIPTSQIIIRKLQIATANPKELDQLIDLEVETALHLPFLNPVYDYIAAGSEEQATNILLYASPQNWIKQCIELLQSAGLKVKHAELPSTAFARAIQAQYKDSLEDTILVHLDDANVEVYMFHEGNPVFMRVINEYDYSGSEDGSFTPELITSINAEIARLLNFYQYSIHDGQTRINQAIIAGAKQGRNQLAAALNQAQPDMKVETIELQSSTRKKSRLRADEFIIPYGLAIKDKKSKAINLMPVKTNHAKRIPAKLVAAFMVWLLILGTILAWYMNNSAQISDLKHEAQVLQDQSALLEQQMTKMNSSATHADDPQAVIAAITSARQDAVAVLDELNKRLPAGAGIATIAYSKPGSITMSVKLNDLKSISDYLVSLRAMPFAGQAVIQTFANNNGQWLASYEVSWVQAAVAKEQEGETNTNG